MLGGATHSRRDLDELAAHVCAEVSRLPVATEAGELACTVSVGATSWRSAESFESALRRADVALYEAKARGRNRAVVRPFAAAAGASRERSTELAGASRERSTELAGASRERSTELAGASRERSA